MLMHIAKWSAQYYNKFYDKDNFQGWNTLAKICNKYHDVFSGEDPLLFYLRQEGFDVVNFLIMLGRQQFVYQKEILSTEIGRTIYLFTEMPCKFNIKTSFETVSNLTPEEFISLCLITWSHAKENPVDFGVVPKGSASWLSLEKFKAFVKLMTFNEQIFREHCKKNDPKNSMYALYWKSPFEEKPFIQYDSSIYIAPFPGFILKRCAYGIYDILKSHYHNDFTELFGGTFENYVRELIEMIKGQFINIFKGEPLVKSQNAKAPDFVLVTLKEIILLEVKSTEMDRAVAKDELLKQNLRDNVIKGINQCMSFTKILGDGSISQIKDAKSKRIISLIVSFKHILFANTPFYWDRVFKPSLEKEGITEFIDNFEYQILDITELECLFGITLHSSINISEILAAKLDSEYEKVNDFETFLPRYIEEKNLVKKYHIPKMVDKFEKFVEDAKANMAH